MTKKAHPLISNYIQHSKKLANWGQIQWVMIVIIVLIIQFIHPIEENTASIIDTVIIWSATLAGITITGYMGNSSVEKYAEKKFSLTNLTSESDEQEWSQG